MDSCNSGSLQSSSGGDEEYDSRATFMTGGIGHGHINPNPPPPTPFFDPFITNYTQQHIISYPKTTPPITDNNNITTNSYAFTHPLHPQPSSTAPPPPPNTAARNPKKRSRASRRAPTTVLTTDTTNFRAMVQEFTGIPAPPFNNMVTSSSFARNRFDLFASSIDMPSYLRSAFAQRVQSSPALPFLAAGGTNKDNIIGSNAVASSSSTQSLNNLSSSIADEQNPFLNSINLPSDRQKIDSFVLGSKDDNQIHGSVGFFSHGQIGSGHLNNNASATFDGGLQNLIIPSSLSTNNVSNLLTRIQDEHVDDYDRITAGKNMVINYPGLSGSKLNVEKGPENSSSERQGMVETWICSSSE